MGEKTDQVMEALRDPAKMDAVTRRLRYARILQSKKCWCGRLKFRRKAFCWPCYSRLPRDIARALGASLGDGYEEAYDAAEEWLRDPDNGNGKKDGQG